MRLVMTLLVRDEADILDAHIAYHLSAGVDFLIATDHRSVDGTTEILESYVRQGVLRLLREDAEFTREHEWQTGMARMAAVEYGADWVINSAADEFWFPRGLSLANVLSAVPATFGVVRGLVHNFIPPLDDSGWFVERLTVRLSPAAPINDPATPFRPVAKVAHRGHPNVSVAGGHQVFGLPLPLLRAWHPLEVLHVPIRSREQCERKYMKTWTGWEENLRGDLARARGASAEGRTDAMWERLALSDAVLERGLADGSLVTDTRLRDALRAVCDSRERASPIPRPETRTSADPTRRELDAHALEVAVFDEAEVVRSQRWVDGLEARLDVLEAGARVHRSHATPGRRLGSARRR